MVNGGKLFLVLMLLSCVGLGWLHANAEEGCLYCGMYRSRFPHAWVELSYRDEPNVGLCSLHCAAIYLALHPSETPGRVLVGDYQRHSMIDADQAHWVIGGDLQGVMTRRAKWAFSNPPEAVKFLSDHGGVAATFDEALEAAFADMYSDTLLIQRRRRGPPDRDSSTAR